MGHFDTFYQPALFSRPGATRMEQEVLADYEAVATPDFMVTAELHADEVANGAERNFFEDIERALGVGRLAQYILTVEYGMVVPADGRLAVTDDFVHRLIVKGGQTLATVERTRDDFNYMLVHYAKYALSQHSLRVIVDARTHLSEDKSAQEA